MRVSLKGTSIDLTEEIRAYIDKKLGTLDKLFENLDSVRADVELEYLKSEERTFRAEFMLHHGGVYRAEARGATLHEAVDKAYEELRLELTSAKKKELHIVRRGAVRAKEFLRGWRNKI